MKKNILLVVATFLIGIVLLFGTYSYLTWRGNITSINFTADPTIEKFIIYEEGESEFVGDFKISSSYLDGVHTTVSISKTNDAVNIPLIATLKLTVNDIGENMSKYPGIKWAVTEGDADSNGALLSQGNFLGVTAGTDDTALTLLTNINVTTTAQEFTVWLWADRSENPNSLMISETLDTSVWMQVDQILTGACSVTQINANYQNITATGVCPDTNITNYAVTTSNTQPSSWTSIPTADQNVVYNLSHIVDSTGTYYVWFKDETGTVFSDDVLVKAKDSSGPSCTWGEFSKNPVKNGDTTQITLTCTDAGVGLPDNTMTTSKVTLSNSALVNNLTMTENTIANGYVYTFTMKATSSNGTTTITLPANTIKDRSGNGNPVAVSQQLSVQNTYTISYKDCGDTAFSGTHGSGYPTSYEYGTGATLDTPTKTGYAFGGYYASSACSGTAVTKVGPTENGNKTFYAKWTANALTFNNQTLDAGSYNDAYSDSFTGASNGTGSYSYTITSVTVDDAAVTASSNKYNGLGLSTTTISGTPSKAGTYKFVIKAKDNGSGAEKSATMTISIAKDANPISVTANTLTYNKAAQALVAVSGAQGNVCYSTSAAVTSCSSAGTIPTGTNAGNYTVYWYVAGNSNYSSKSGSVTVTIGKYNLSNATIASTSAQTYTGSEIKPTPTVTVPLPSGSTTTLTVTTDFTYSYTNNTNAGTATITVTGTGNYSGSKTSTFTINKKPITVSKTNYSGTYDKKSHTFTLTTTPSTSVTIYYSTSTALTSSNYSTSGTTTKPTRTDAGTTTVYYYVHDTSGNYSDYASNANNNNATITIAKYNLSNATIASTSAQTYTGSEIKPTPAVTVPLPSGSTTTLVSGTDFTYSYTNNTNAGTATITVTGTGNYTGTKTSTFTINKKPITVSKTNYSGTYDKKSHTFTLTTTPSTSVTIYYSTSTALTSSNYSTSGTTTKPTRTDAGTTTVYYYVHDTSGNYSDYASNANNNNATITIAKYNLSNATIASTSAQTYTGSEIKPTPAVTVPLPSGSTTTLVSGTDFTYSYTNNTNAGTATITVTGTGNYTGTKTSTFTINKKPITVSKTNYSGTYDKKSHTFTLTTTPSTSVTIYYSTSTALTSSNYSTSGTTTKPTRTDAGTTTVYYYVHDTSGNYSDYASNANNNNATITIAKYNLSNATIASTSDQTYTGSEIKPTPAVTVPLPSGSTTTLTVTTDFTYGYTNNKNEGTATITVTGTGNYTGTKTTTFKIIRYLTVPSQSGSLTYNKASQSPSWSNYNTTYMTIGGTTSGTNAGSYSATFTLKDTTNTKWSDGTTAAKTVTWTIGKYNLSNATIASVSAQAYTGSAIKPTPAVTVPLPSGSTTTLAVTTDFTYSYSNNTNIGTATITVTGAGNYTGTKTRTFSITDQTKPTATLTITSTLKSTSQTATLKCSDNVGVTGYYFGTSSTGGTYTTTASELTSLTGSSGLTKTVSSTGTYYLFCKDAAGNANASGSSSTKTVYSYTVNNLLEKVDGTTGTYTNAHYESKSTSGPYIAPSGTSLTLATLYTVPTGSSSSKFIGQSTSFSSSAVTPKNEAPSLNSNMTVYMWFNRTTHALTLNKGTGISSVGGAGTYKYGKVVSISATATNGYTFSKWTVSSGNTPASTSTASTSITITQATTLRADSNGGNEYTISYLDCGGGAFSGTHDSGYPTKYKTGTGTTLDTPSKTGYTFGGYFTTSACTGTAVTSIGTSEYGNKTFYAKWTANSYNLVRRTNNNILENGDFEAYTLIGKQSSTKNGITGYWDGELNGVPGNPEQTYHPNPWSTGANMGVAIPEVGYHAHMRIVDGNAVFRFKTNEDYNGITTSPQNNGTSIISGTVTSRRWLGVTQAIPENRLTAGKRYRLTLDAYRVSGSNKITGGVRHAVSTTSALNFHSGTATLTTTSTKTWETLSWDFTLSSAYTGSPTIYIYGYIDGTGEIYIDNVKLEEIIESSKTYNTAYTSTELATPTWVGHTFAGWYNNSSFSTTITTSNNFTNSTATFKNVETAGTDAEIFGKWTPITYDIAYNYNGGTAGTYKPTTGTFDSAIRISNPTRSGYTFAGWTYTNGDTSTARYGSSTTSAVTAWSTSTTKRKEEYFKNLRATSGTVTLTANWTGNSYTITYKDCGDTTFSGTHISDYPTKYTTGTGATLDTPTKTGYTFGGYYTASACSGTAVTSIGTSEYGNKTLYAKWTANSLTFNNQTLTNGTYLTAYSKSFTGASNGTGSYTYTLKSVKLGSTTLTASSGKYNGLSVSSTTISGTPSKAGTYYFEIEAKDNGSSVTKSATITIVIDQYNLSNATIATVSAQTYTGSQIKPTPAVTVPLSGTTTLTSGTDFTYGYTNNTNAGTATITVTGTGNYTGTKTTTFTINAASVTVPTASYCNSLTYNGASQTLTKTAPTGANFSSNTGTDAKEYTVTASLKSTTNYKWSDSSTANKTFKCSIAKKSATITAKNQTITYGSSISTGVGQITTSGFVSGHSVTAITLTPSTSAATTSGTITPSSATVKDGNSNTVTSNYNISYVNGTLTIGKKDISTVTTTISPTSYAYDGNAKKPTVTVKDGSTTLTGIETLIPAIVPNSNATYSNGTIIFDSAAKNDNPGSQSVKLQRYLGSQHIDQVLTKTAVGEYEYVFTKDSTFNKFRFAVNGNKADADVNIDLSGLTNGTSYTFKFKITVYNTYYVEVEGLVIYPTNTTASYVYSYAQNVNIGTGKVIVTGINNYYSYTKKDFTITDQTKPTSTLTMTSNLKANSQTATLKCSDNIGVTGYYFGTSSTGGTYTTTASELTSLTGSSGLTKTVSSSGTYYLFCKDAQGNVSNSTSKTVYSYTVNNMRDKLAGTQGTYNTTNYEQISTNTYIAPSGTSLTLASIYTSPGTINTQVTFAGVSTGAASTTAVTPSTTAPSLSANSTYSMWFNRKTFTLTLNKGTGISSVSGSGTKKWGASVSISATATDGYTFSKWTVSSGNTPASTTTASTTISLTQDTTLRADSNGGNIYTITLDNQSATTAGTTKAYYQYNTTKTVNGVTCYYFTDSALTTCLSGGSTITKPAKTGYTFKGYYTGTSGSGTQYVNASGGFINNIYKTVGNRTLYAYWKDETAPTVSVAPKFATGGDTYTPGTCVTDLVHTDISAVDYGSGVDKIQYIVKSTYDNNSSASWTTFNFAISNLTKTSSNPPTWTGTEQWGNTNTRDHEYYIRACDEDGNCTAASNFAQWHICYDLTAPTVSYEAYFADGSGNYTSDTWTNKDVYTRITGVDNLTPISKIQYTANKNATTEGNDYTTQWKTLTLGISSGIKQNSSPEFSYYGIESWSKRSTRNDTFYFRVCDESSTHKEQNCSAASSAFTIKYDTEAPSATLTMTSNLKSTSQTATLKCSDNVGVTGYYFGTSSTGSPTTTTASDLTALTGSGLTKTVSSSGTYYLFCKDSLSQKGSASKTVYSYTVNNMLDKTAGTQGTYNTTNYEQISTNTYIAPSGTSLTLASIYTSPGTLNTEVTFAGVSTGAASTTAVTPSSTAPSLSANSTYSMWFNRKSYTVTLTAGNGISAVSGGGSKKWGASVSIDATVTSGYTWSNWTGYNTQTTKAYTFTMPAQNVSYTANASGSSKTATFYYYNGSSVTSTTASCVGGTSCNVTIPTAVTGSTGKYSGTYVGLASSTNTMTASISSTATTASISSNATYYALYRKNVTVYYPTSTSAATSATWYRNEYLTSTSAITSKLSTSNTGTSNETTISGILGTYKGLATAVNSTTTITIATAAAQTATTYYGVSTTSVTATFYYYNGSSVTSTTAAGTRTNYCSATNTATTSAGNITVPSSVTASKGKYNSAYKGVASTTGTMSTVTPTTATATYYAVYQTSVTNYYYSSSYTSRTLYRNEWLTSTSACATPVLSTSASGTSNYSTATGPGSSVWTGLASTSTTTVGYSSVSAAAQSTATKLYTIYQFNVTYAKGANVSAIGATSGNCKVTTSSTSCTVTLPTITANTGYTSVGWSSTSGATTGTAAGASYTLSTNASTLYGNATDQTKPICSFGTWTNETSVIGESNTIVLTCTDAGSGVSTTSLSSSDFTLGGTGSVSVGSITAGGTAASKTFTITVTGSSIGTVTISLLASKVSDASNNKNIAVGPSSILTIPDTIAPAITFTPNTNTTYAKTHSTVVSVTDHSTLSVLKYQWLEEPDVEAASSGTTFTSGQTLTTPAQASGTKPLYLCIYAEDSQGNIAKQCSGGFLLDNDGPQLSEIPNIYVNESETGIKSHIISYITASDVSGIASSKTIKAVKGSTTTTLTDTTTLTSGEYTIYYTFSDNLGNSSTSSGTMSVYRDLREKCGEVTTTTNFEGLYVDPTDANRCVYRGGTSDTVNNYVRMPSGQYWRILGVESDGTVKIVANSRYNNTTYQFHTAQTGLSWTKTMAITTSLQTIWNNYSSEDRSLVTSHSFNIGNLTYGSSSTNTLAQTYTQEKTLTTNRSLGLPSATDYIKASTSCAADSKWSSTCPKTLEHNWMYHTDYVYWIMNLHSSSRARRVDSSTGGFGIGYLYSTDKHSILPVMFLKDNLSFVGSGTYADPYIPVIPTTSSVTCAISATTSGATLDNEHYSNVTLTINPSSSGVTFSWDGTNFSSTATKTLTSTASGTVMYTGYIKDTEDNLNMCSILVDQRKEYYSRRCNSTSYYYLQSRSCQGSAVSTTEFSTKALCDASCTGWSSSCGSSNFSCTCNSRCSCGSWTAYSWGTTAVSSESCVTTLDSTRMTYKILN